MVRRIRSAADGSSGMGTESVTRTLHRQSPRREQAHCYRTTHVHAATASNLHTPHTATPSTAVTAHFSAVSASDKHVKQQKSPRGTSSGCSKTGSYNLTELYENMGTQGAVEKAPRTGLLKQSQGDSPYSTYTGVHPGISE